jgi:hypothetical protein
VRVAAAIRGIVAGFPSRLARYTTTRSAYSDVCENMTG